MRVCGCGVPLVSADCTILSAHISPSPAGPELPEVLHFPSMSTQHEILDEDEHDPPPHPPPSSHPPLPHSAPPPLSTVSMTHHDEDSSATVKSQSPVFLGCIDNVRSLDKVWYVIVSVTLNLILLGHTVRDYLLFKHQAYDPRYGGQWNEMPLNVALAVMLMVCAHLPLHLYSGFIRVGHIVNDGGTWALVSGLKMRQQLDQLYQLSTWKLLLKRAAYHGRPCVYLLHWIVAAVLLVPTPLFRAEQIRNEAVSRDHLWKSELFRVLCEDQQNGYPVYLELTSFTPSSSSILPEQHTTLFRSAFGCSKLTSRVEPSMSLATVNFLLASVMLVSHYPSVFWSSTPSLAHVYSAYGLLGVAQHLLEFHCFSIHHQLHVNQLLNHHRIALISSPVCLVLLMIGFLILVANMLLIFEYGHLHALLSLSRHRQYFLSDASSKVFVEETIVKTSNRCMSRYWPNALGLVLYVGLVAVKVVTLCEYVLAWGYAYHAALLVYVVVTVVFLLATLMLWFTFSVKREWPCHLHSGAPRDTQTDTQHASLDNPRLNGTMQIYPEEKSAGVMVHQDDLMLAQNNGDLYYSAGGPVVALDSSRSGGSQQASSSCSPPPLDQSAMIAGLLETHHQLSYPGGGDNFNYSTWRSGLSHHGSLAPTSPPPLLNGTEPILPPPPSLMANRSHSVAGGVHPLKHMLRQQQMTFSPRLNSNLRAFGSSTNGGSFDHSASPELTFLSSPLNHLMESQQLETQSASLHRKNSHNHLLQDTGEYALPLVSKRLAEENEEHPSVGFNPQLNTSCYVVATARTMSADELDHDNLCSQV